MKIMIVGGGINGVMAAYFLLDLKKKMDCKDVRVVLVESDKIANAASGNAGGFLAKDWHSKETSSLARLSYSLHAKLAEQFEGDKNWDYRELNTAEITLDETDDSSSLDSLKVDKNIKNEVDGWINMSFVRELSLIGSKSSTSQVTPSKFTDFFYRKSVDMGLEFINDHVLSINRQTRTIILEKQGKASFDILVVAAGPWTANLLPDIKESYSLHSCRAHSILIETDITVPPCALFTDITTKSKSRADPEIFPRPNRKVYACAGSAGFAEKNPVPLPDKPDCVELDEQICKKIKCTVSSISPILANGTIKKMSACYLPLSDRPVIGKIKNSEIFVACGHGVWGITLGPGTGKVLSELIILGKAKSANIQGLLPF